MDADASLLPSRPLAHVGRRRWRRWIGAVVANISRMTPVSALMMATRDVYPRTRRWRDQAVMREAFRLVMIDDIATGLASYAACKNVNLPPEMLPSGPDLGTTLA
jgi:hypothetical protein